MRKILFALTALIAAACATELPQDRLVCGGKSVPDIAVQVQTQQPEGFPGMTLRQVTFVNNGSGPVTVDAMETSRICLDGKEIWSLQPSSTADRKDWVLPVEKGFYQRNYLGMNGSDYGGGIPMVSIWNPAQNRSVGVAEPVLKLVSMPVQRRGSHTEACIRQDFETPVVLQPGESLCAVSQFILEGEGDFFQPLRSFANYMRETFGFEAPVSPEDAYEPVWCAWGYERTFTVDEVIGTLPKVVELGFKWVDIDDGYQRCEGDWETNDRIGPEGMRRMTDAIHGAGLKAKIWWAPMAADPESELAKNHPELLLVQADGTHEDISWWDSWYISPVNPYTKAYTENLVDMFIKDWGFDGFKLDGQHLNLSAPDYNPSSGLAYPEQVCERHPEFFMNLYNRAQLDKPGSVVQICPCGCAVNFFFLPYMNQAVASDPTSSAQIRMKRKVYAALCPDLAYYADHVELSDGGMDFASQVGVGGVIGTKFTWPKVNPDAQECGGSLLTPEKEEALRKWVPIYSEKMLSKGKYLGLYTYGIDKPEGHVIEKDGAMYYAFYAPEWKGEPVTLRGLDPSKTYTVTEYTLDEPRSYELDGANPVIRPTFTGNYLIEVK
ncbi:MAG: alpha-galactosidase [Bacteroidales bacterium]|nr:alpha-galactosidase [Bacteroidales bacterium]